MWQKRIIETIAVILGPWCEDAYYGEENYEKDEWCEPNAEESSNAVTEYDDVYSNYMDARKRMNKRSE